MSIKGVPTDAACPLADLIVAGEHTVASRGLACQQVADLTLFAFAAGESVSEERYPADTVYVCLEGTLAVACAEGQRMVPAGSCLKVCAGMGHAVSGADRCAVQVPAGQRLGTHGAPQSSKPIK